MATIPVKYFHSGMTGAPQLSGTAGALVTILDACLKDGFALKTVDSLVVASNVATMNISTGHSFEVGSVALVAGASPSTLNGEWRVTAITMNTVQFATSGIADQTATGTITTKLAPLNWIYGATAGTNLRAYKSANSSSPGHVLRVDDTGSTDARVVGYESMSDINTGSGPFPTSGQLSGGLYWHKSTTANSTARNWVVIGDDRFFYYWSVPGDATTVTSQGRVVGFGDPELLSSGDTYGTTLTGMGQTATSMDYPYDLSVNNVMRTDTSYGQMTSPRSYTGIGSSVQQSYYFENCAMGDSSLRVSGSGTMTFPNGPDNGLLFMRGLIVPPGAHVRGKMPGLYLLPQNVGFAFATKDVVVGQNDLSGKRLIALRTGLSGSGQNSTGGIYGVVMVDMLGPWR